MIHSRREFFSLSTSAAISFFGVSIYSYNISNYNIAKLLNFSKSTLVVGRHYVESNSFEDSIKSLICNMPICHNEKTWRASIERRIRNDFYNNNVIQLRGWVLSSTEANIAALTWLIYKKNKS